MLAFASLVFAVVPVLVYVWLVWIMDRYDREPVGLLLVNFAWGAVGAVALSIGGSIAMSAAVDGGQLFDTVIVAPVVEEIMKASFLLWTVRRRAFDNVTDGLVYGMAIGLGFGMTENFFYFLAAGSASVWIALVVIRTLFSVLVHALATGVCGAFIGMTKFQFRRYRWPLRALGLVLAESIHFIWNASISLRTPASVGLGFLFVLASAAVILALVQVALSVENRTLLRELADEAARGVLPASHLRFLPFVGRRRIAGWLPPHVHRGEYCRTATLLAFRKAELPFTTDAERPSYAAEIEALRARIAAILLPGAGGAA
jgi:RsiW-degrading membrane proteinase PrsW (M82 family)